MNNRKLRVGFVSNCPVGGKTGLARNMKAILPLLYKTSKYEIFFLAQGMPDNDPNYQRLPWKTEGAMKDFDQQKFQQDPNFQRAVAYGNTAVEGFVIRNKLDCLILSDDQWAFSNEKYLDTEWFKYMKQNVLPVITADSLPLLPQIKEWAEKCPNMRFWSKFAPETLKKENSEKYKHCDVIYGAMNTEDFKPLLKNEKLEIRRKFGIQDDEKIILYLGRNQLRKIFGSHIEGLAKFRKRHPDKKLRLLFHTSWSEFSGWPLNQIREQNGLKKEDILTTYFCRNCQDWNIQPFDGEELNCPVCKAQKSRITAGVSSTITEEDLNKIYNISDGAASIFTSGSFELKNSESLLAGVPLAVPNYVCGQDFLESGVVYEIKGTLTFEHQTGFKKFVPDINSVCDFFEFIYNLPESKRVEIVNKGRKFAVDNFDARNVVKKYEEFLDSCQPIDWDIYSNKKKELKNPAAPIDLSIPDDFEFIVQAYEKILNMNDMRDKNKPEIVHWLSFLNQPKDKNQLRNEMAQTFRQIAAQKNAEQQKISLEDLLDKNDKSRVLLILKESLGDCYLLSALLPEIKNKYPDSSIYLATDPKYWEIFDGNENLRKCIPWSLELENELSATGFGSHKGLFSHFINIGLTSQRNLNYLTNLY